MVQPPQLTVIAEGVMIQGSIQAEGGIELRGEVAGNIVSKGDLRLHGRLVGDVAGKNVEILGGWVNGNVTASGNTKVDEGAVVIGDIRTEALAVNGRIKGDLTVQKSLAMESDAVVVGTVTAQPVFYCRGRCAPGRDPYPRNGYRSSVPGEGKKRQSVKKGCRRILRQPLFCHFSSIPGERGSLRGRPRHPVGEPGQQGAAAAQYDA